MPVPTPSFSKKPETPAEWRAHAEELHGRGLEMIDIVSGMRDVPADLAKANSLHAQTLFLAAQSATAMAAHLGTIDSSA